MTIRDNLYYYSFRVDRVIDGDTIVGKLDKGRNNFDEDVHLRLLGIQAPEIGSHAKTEEERKRGDEARLFLIELILGKTVVVHTKKADDEDSFGRMLADIWVPELDDLHVNQYMIDRGHAIPYKG